LSELVKLFQKVMLVVGPPPCGALLEACPDGDADEADVEVLAEAGLVEVAPEVEAAAAVVAPPADVAEPVVALLELELPPQPESIRLVAATMTAQPVSRFIIMRSFRDGGGPDVSSRQACHLEGHDVGGVSRLM
jgi:hypothetical protein